MRPDHPVARGRMYVAARGASSASMALFEYIFTPDDPRDEPAGAPQRIDATSVEDAIQILFLTELEERAIPGTLKVRRCRGGERWIVQRFVPLR
jgi:hypothetical protein